MRQRFEIDGIALRLAALHVRCRREARIVQMQRREDVRCDDIAIRHVRAAGERVTEKTEADVRVIVGRADAVRWGVTGDELVEQRGGVAGVFVVGIAGHEIVRAKRQAGGVGGKIGERDLARAVLRQFGFRRQVFGDGIVQRDVAMCGHVGEREGGEDLRQRADVVDGVAVDFVGAVFGGGAVGDDAMAARCGDADDDAGGPMLLLDAVLQCLAERGVGRHRVRDGGDAERGGEGDKHFYHAKYVRQRNGRNEGDDFPHQAKLGG